MPANRETSWTVVTLHPLPFQCSAWIPPTATQELALAQDTSVMVAKPEWTTAGAQPAPVQAKVRPRPPTARQNSADGQETASRCPPRYSASGSAHAPFRYVTA